VGLSTDPDTQSQVFTSLLFPSEAPHVDIHLPGDPPPLPSRTFTPIADEEIRATLLEASNVTQVPVVVMH